MNKETRKVIIVEGKNDMHRVKQVLPDAYVLITNGSAISEEFLKLVEDLSRESEIVLVLDPDYSGEVIRKKITSVVPNASHIFFNKKDAISKTKRKVGVEHVTLNKLRIALKDVKQYNYSKNITIQDIFDLGLAGEENSKSKRLGLCEKLGIGYVNAKQLVERLNMFGYKLEDIKDKL